MYVILCHVTTSHPPKNSCGRLTLFQVHGWQTTPVILSNGNVAAARLTCRPRGQQQQQQRPLGESSLALVYKDSPACRRGGERENKPHAFHLKPSLVDLFWGRMWLVMVQFFSSLTVFLGEVGTTHAVLSVAAVPP